MIQKIELSEEYNLTKVTDLGCNVSKIFVQKYSLISFILIKRFFNFHGYQEKW